MKLFYILILCITVGLLFIFIGCADNDDKNYINKFLPYKYKTCNNNFEDTRLKLVAPKTGMYIGQSDINNGIKTFEKDVGVKVALAGIYPQGVIEGVETPGFMPIFDVEAAKASWEEGYVIQVYAWEAGIEFGFNIDKILRGDYDEQLRGLSDQFKKFGKPMIFVSAREPNGVMSNGGGYGPNFQAKIIGRYEGRDNTGQFDPIKIDNPDVDESKLYAGLGDDSLDDALERLIAVHRYYYDFFINREGIDFLTFETMGWAVLPSNDDSPNGEMTRKYLTLMKDYSDWISINIYLANSEDKCELCGTWSDFERVMKIIREVDPGKPVMFTELGLFGEKKIEKINFFFSEIISNYPEVKGFLFWGDFNEPYDPDNEYTTIIINTQMEVGSGAKEMKALLAEYPQYFHSCAMFSDGTVHPKCDGK